MFHLILYLSLFHRLSSINALILHTSSSSCSLAKLYAAKANFNDIMQLLKSNNNFFSQIPKARTAKIVRSVLDIASDVPDSVDQQVVLSKDVVSWCVAEKRTFLRQRIEGKVRRAMLLLCNNFCLYAEQYVILSYCNTLMLCIRPTVLYPYLQLANLLLVAKSTQEALQLINSLLRELKKLDDKQMLTEAHLTEARIYHAMQNVPKGE